MGFNQTPLPFTQISSSWETLYQFDKLGIPYLPQLFTPYSLFYTSLQQVNWYSGSVVERPLCDREVAGSIPILIIPKTVKMVLAALLLGAQH